MSLFIVFTKMVQLYAQSMKDQKKKFNLGDHWGRKSSIEEFLNRVAEEIGESIPKGHELK